MNNEIDSLRLIVNHSPQFAKLAAEAEQLPANGSQILNVIAQKDVVLKLSKPNAVEGPFPLKKEDDRNKREKKKNERQREEGGFSLRV